MSKSSIKSQLRIIEHANKKVGKALETLTTLFQKAGRIRDSGTPEPLTRVERLAAELFRVEKEGDDEFEPDPWADKILQWCDNPYQRDATAQPVRSRGKTHGVNQRVYQAEILPNAINGFGPNDPPPNHADKLRVGRILRRAGWPSAPPKNGKAPSSQSLQTRVRYHYSGNAEGSTLRLTHGCLLAKELGIELRRVGSGERMTFSTAEVRLSGMDGSQRQGRVARL
jgi:hypothetical protein